MQASITINVEKNKFLVKYEGHLICHGTIQIDVVPKTVRRLRSALRDMVKKN